MSGKDPRSEASKKRDLISRGVYTPTPLGTALFFILRGIDPLLQYSILRGGGIGTSFLHKLGLNTLPPGLPARTGIPLIDGLELSPYRMVLLAMSTGSMVKQNIWLTFLSGEPMPPSAAIIVSAFNTLVNTLNNVLFLIPATSASRDSDALFPQWPLMVGASMYTVGILTELVSEIQRKRFKSDPKNKGKPYTGGLWQLARHINYGAYSVWRGGYALAAGGWIWGGVFFSFQMYDFATRGVPILDEYCTSRYGEDWANFKTNVRWRLLPGIY